ncbi:MAG: PD-(D/E)XK nuclease family protein [Planctomycetota bacterium]
MPPFENRFSWSFSRSRTFADCPRKYWFHYYGSWGGWGYDAPDRARELYQLKNITGLHLIAGDVVHRAIERALQDWARGQEPDAESVVQWCKAEMQKGFKESQDELWREQPKKYTRLFEHHYGPPPTRELLQKIANKVGTSVRNFFESRSYAIIREIDPDKWLPMETLDSFDFEGTQVYAVPDFAAEHDGAVLIFDWKTGRPDAKNNDQIVLYALFAAAKWGADPDKVEGAPVYLLTGGDFQPQHAAAADRDRVAKFMRESIATMKSSLDDPEKNEASEEKFPATPGFACRSCNYRGVCPDAK